MMYFNELSQEEIREQQYHESVERIWKMRTGYGISQERIADFCGISRQYLSEIESHKRIVPERLLQKIGIAIRQESGEEPLEIIIDYFRVRIPTQDIRMVLEDLLKLRMEYFRYEDYGFYGYAGQYILGDIVVMVSPKEENGVLIELKGKGCRQFERYLNAQKRDWYQFFREVINKNGKFKRVDIAINDKFGILDISKLIEKRIKGEYGGYLKKFRIEQSGQESRIREEHKMEMGKTLYLGSMKSDIYFCIYEKDYEQLVRNGIPLADAEIKNRFEIRLKNERAEQAVIDLAQYESPASTAFGIINHYTWFLKPKRGRKKESWDMDEDWLLFIGNENRNLKLTTKPEPYSFNRTLQWFSKQVAPMWKTALEIDTKNGTNIINDMLDNARLKEKHQKLIEQQTLHLDDIIL